MEGIGINLPLLVAFLINFVILFALLSVVLYKPVLKMLDERQARIRESMEQAEQTKEERARSEEQVKANLEAARQEAQKIISQATQTGETLKEQAKEKAHQEAESMIVQARAQIERERDKAIGELREEFVDVAILAAEKVINETLDKEKHRALIDDVLQESTSFRQT